MIDGVSFTNLKVIDGADGAVMQGLKRSESTYSGFGEAYFSTVGKHRVKAWRRHHEMVMNLVVPVGRVGFVLIDTRDDSPTLNGREIYILSPDNYFRLTIPPLIWFGFKGLNDGINMVMNIASIEHNPVERDSIPASKFYFDWSTMT